MNCALTDTLRKKTSQCPYDFSCVATGKCGTVHLCEIRRKFDTNMLYVKTTTEKESALCPYKMSCGNSNEHICTCPTHYEIYLQKKTHRNSVSF